MWVSEAEAPPPLVASAQDLAKALRPMTLGSSEGCVGDGDPRPVRGLGLALGILERCLGCLFWGGGELVLGSKKLN